MIAPLRSDDSTTTVARRNLREARRAIAAALLREPSAERPRAPQPVRWRVWLWVAWALTVASFDLAVLLRL